MGERNGDSLQRIFLTANKCYIKDFSPPRILPIFKCCVFGSGIGSGPEELQS